LQNRFLQLPWPWRFSPSFSCALRPSRRFFAMPLLNHRFPQSFPRNPAVEGLRTRIFHSHEKARRPMAENDGRGNLIDVLAARTGRTGETFLEIALIKREVGIVVTGGFHSLACRALLMMD
jgi:hypothetical protein